MSMQTNGCAKTGTSDRPKRRLEACTIEEIDSKRATPDEKKKDVYDGFYSPDICDFYHSFQYPSFTQHEKSIRLLYITPSKNNEDDNAPIRCDIVDDVSLEGMIGEYTTSSYCAGNNTKTTKVILINGINAFTNLGHAL